MANDGEGNMQDYGQQHDKSRKQLSLQRKREICDAILIKMQGGTVPRGFKAELERKIDLHKSTIKRLFQDIATQMAQGNVIDVRSKKIGRVGRKPMELSVVWLHYVPLYKRTTERSYASALKISQTTIHNLRKRGKIRTHTSTTHLSLTSDHKIKRLRWALAHINPTPPNEDPRFVDMQHDIHIDEKWFYLNLDTRTFYLLPKEEDPYMCLQSKRYKLKAMFMAMIGKPLFYRRKNLVHDRKYGISLFVYHQTTKNKSKNREAGTIKVKAVQNVNREVIREMLLKNIFPTIWNKWQSILGKDVFIQWDNAKPHQIPQDEEFEAATKAYEFNIQLIIQPG